MDCKVYVGDLGYGAAKQELEDAFSKYGPLRNVWVARNPPGFAFVEFEDPRDAEDSVRALDGTRMNGRRVRIELSTGRSRRGGRRPMAGADRGSRYGGGGYGGDRGSRDRYSRKRSRSYSPRGRGRSYSRSRSRSRSPSRERRRSASRERRTSIDRFGRNIRGRSASKSRSRSPAWKSSAKSRSRSRSRSGDRLNGD